MTTEIAQFLSDVASAVQDRVGTEVETKTTKAGYWYCWLPRTGATADDCFQVWCSSEDPEIVLGRLELGTGAPSAEEVVLKRLASVTSLPHLQDFCTPGAGGSWSLFTVTIQFGQDNPVEAVAERLAKLFLAAEKAQGASEQG